MQDDGRSNVEKLSSEARAALERRLLEKRRRAPKRTGISRRDTSVPAPLSFAQQRMWLLEQMAPGYVAHVIADAVLLEGDLDVNVLRRSFEELVRRHESLRTTFRVVDGEPMQIVADASTFELPVEDLAGAPDEALHTRARNQVVVSLEQPIDLERGPILRATLHRTGNGRYLLLILVHHIASDAWSNELMMGELARLYGAYAADEPSPLAPPALQYADFAVWQRETLQGAELDRQMAYWREQLAGVPNLEMPTDRPRPALPEAHGRHESLVLPPELTGALRALGGSEEYTVYMVMLAAVSLLLHRYSGQDDIVVGSPIAGRNRSELEGVVGFFINMLVLRTDVAGDPTGRALLDRVRETILAANEHQDVPFEKLVDELHPARDLSRTPFFQVAYEYRRLATDAPEATGLPMRPVGFALDVTRFDLELHAWERGDDIGVQVVYRTDLFDASTVQRMLGHLTALLEGIVRSPDVPVSQLELLTADERRRLVHEWNETDRPFRDDRCLHQWFEQHAIEAPDSIALVLEDETLTYGELDRRANRLAYELRARGVRPDALVGICADRGFDMVVGILGILKAGGAYVPLDPGYPAERLAFMLADSGVSILLTQTHLVETLPDHGAEIVCLDRDVPDGVEFEAALPCVTTPENLAYVIYTSGSTGTPKGALLRHRGICNLSEEQTHAFGVGPGSRVLQFSSLSFDASTFEIVMALAKGATLYLGRRETLLPGPDLLAFLIRHAISIVTLPPSALAALPVESLPDLTTITVAGEACPAELVARWAPGRRFFNLYGPTEATIWSTMAELEETSGPPHIGRPIGNTRIYVLDDRMRPVPVGVPGELYIAGTGLGRGYHGRRALTAERFVPNPFSDVPGDRLYRSGDLVRYRADGNLDFLGRIDHQVKVRGFRIELGEIEATLARHPAVRETTVLCREDQPGEKQLVAYVVGAADGPPAATDMRRYLGEILPDYMVPAAFVHLDALPVTRNGKIDRAALPAPAADRTDPATYLAPRSELEARIGAIWCEILGLEQVGVRDNFFELGGHSLRLVQMHTRLVEALDCPLSVTDLFQLPTVEMISERLRGTAGPATDLRRAAQVRVERRGQGPRDAIAVIGMSIRVPGAADVEAFWANLRNGVESVRFYADETLRELGVTDAVLQNPSYVKAQPALDDVDLFDARYFGYTPREAEIMDPQHRVLLECAVDALERAGYDPDRYAGLIGVYAGSSSNEYRTNVRSNPDLAVSATGLSGALGSNPDFLPTRVSYKLNLRGPSVNIQTACSTSLVAVHYACEALLNQQCDMALVGGVAISVPNVGGYLFHDGGIVSPDGHCRTFDARAQGTLRGDGAGLVVLKRLDEALRDGDDVHAVILGTAVNNDGSHKVGYTAPSIDGQAEVIAMAQAAAGVEPETITYVEAHGTATPLGDPIEVAALTRVFRERTDRTGYCGLGSVKSNMGHLDAAAGVTGLIKTVLALEHGELPPSLHYERPNPEIDFDASPFFVNTTLRPWTPDGVPRRAGVSSFGLGGTNAHVVLEQPPALAPSEAVDGWQLLVLSAKTKSALAQARSELAEHLRANPSMDLADAAFTLQVGRRQLEHRLAVRGRDVEDVVAALEDGGADLVGTGHTAASARPVVFMFPGQGAQDVNMGRDLYDQDGTFREAVDACLAIVDEELGLGLRDVLYPEGDVTDAARARLKQTSMAQPALFTISYALARQWMAWGVQPESMIGHSIGEYVAACIAGVLELDDALRLVVSRGRLMESMPAGVMTAVTAPRKDVEAAMAGADDLWMSALNAPGLNVVSAHADRMEAFEARLAALGIEYRRLHTSHAFHSGMMDDAVAPFVEAVAGVTIGAPRIPYVSNVTGDWVTEADVRDAAYWGRHIREPVQFAAGMERLLADASRVLLEVGPGQALAAMAKQQDGFDRDRTVVSSMRRVKSKTAAPGVPSVADTDEAHLAAAIGRLWISGVDIDWPALHGAARRRRVTLPTYPFQRERYWAEGRVTTVAAPVAGRRANLADWFYAPVWRRTRIEDSVAHPAVDGGSILVFARDMPIDRRIIAGLEASGRSVVIVRPGRSFGGGDFAYEIDPTAAADYTRLLGEVQQAHGAPAEIVHLWTVSFAAQRPSDDDADEIQRHGLQSLLLLAGGLAGADVTHPVRINVVTDGVHGVSGDELIQPEKATMLGFCRTVPLEIPNVSCRSVDLAIDGGGEPDERDVDGLVDELFSTRSNAMVALRRGHRWVQSFVRVPLAAVPDDAAQRRLRPKGTYLITGGLGGIGLELAGMLARDVQARLVLTTRSPLPERGAWAAYVEEHAPGDLVVARIRAIEAMEAAGAEVMVAETDVSDFDGMQRVTAEAQRRFGSINGVIHLAGVPGGEIIQATEPEAVARTLAPKVTGTRVLERLFGDAELDFLVLSSSLITSWSVPGFVDYSAANAFLDSFARRFAADTGTFTVAIDWPRWSEAGMAVDFARAHGVHTPIQGITNAEGVEVFRRVLGGCDEAQILVSEVDFRESLGRQAAATADRGRAQGSEDDTSGARARHARPEVSTPFLAPRDENEEGLARIWRNLFGIEDIGVHDNFFELGGDSVLSIQMAARAKEARIPLTTKNVMELPTIALLAATVDDAAPGAPAPRESQQPVVGDVPLTPIQQWFLELDLEAPDHFNHAVLLQARCDLPRAQWDAVVRALLEHHDALRLRVIRQGGGWRQISAEPTDSVPFTIIDLSGEPEGTRAAAIETHAAELQASLDLAAGPIVRIALFDLGPDQPARLLVVAHHLAIDAVSWPIVLEDLARLVDQQIRGVEMELPAKTTSYQAWARRLHEHALSPAVAAEVSYWNDLPWSRVAPLPVDVADAANTVGEAETVSVALDEAETRRLLREVPPAYRTRIDEVLLAALVGAFESWTGSSTLLVDVEGHGREPLFDDVDLSRTVGWFTSMYPVVLDSGAERGPGATLKRVKEQVRSVPGRGIGYGLLRYLHPDPAIVDELRSRPAAEVSFLYFGQQAAARGDAAEGTLGPATEATGAGRSPRNHRAHLIEIMSGIGEGRLAVQWMYSTQVHRRETVEAIAERFIQSLREIIEHCSSGEAHGHTPSDFPYAAVSQDELDRIEARHAPDDIEDLLTLSPMQRGMLFHRLQDPDSGMYMEQTRLRMDGLDAGAFRRAWERVVERHAALRTSIIDVDSAEPLQLVHRQVPLPLVEHDARETPAADVEAWIDAFADAERHRVFGPNDASRMRLALIRVGGDAYEFVWTVEHLIIDGWSKTLLIGEVFGFYGREKDGIAFEPDEPRPYRDYIAWLHTQDPAEAAAYWQGALGDVEAGTLVGRASATEPGGDEPEIVERQGVVSEDITRQLKVLAAKTGVTLNTVVLAAWSLLLGRCVGTDDLVLGTPVTGRPPDLPGVESIVGLCLNTVPIRVRLDDDATLSSWLRTLHAQQIERSRFEYSPLWEVQRWSGVPAGTPLFDNLFLFQNYPVETSQVARSRGISVQARKFIEHVSYPVMLAVHPGERILFRLTCDLTIVDADAMGRLLDHLATVLRGFASDPQQRLRDIALLDDEASEQIVVAWNRTTQALATEDCLHQLFEAQARRTPDAVALTCGTSDLGYAELDGRANRLAHRLVEMGVGPEHLVGICLPRGIDMVVGILGVLKAGAAYVPLDPAYPAERLAFIVEDAAAAIVLTHEALLAVLPEHTGEVICLDRDASSIAACSAERPSPRASLGNLAYVIYTSGSTGRPKGTLITHGNAASLVHWARTTYSDEELSGVLASTSMCFDLSIFELFVPLSWGGSVILAEDALATPSLPARDRVTLINTVPSAMTELVRQNAVPEAVRVVNLAGEPLATALADRIYEAGVERVYDLYGPSEDTTYSTCALRAPGSVATIGRPIANKQAYILDRDLRPVPVGFLGELYVGGAGVARGYLNRPALTAERFIPNPFAADGGQRLYRTGDLARYRADGCIEFCGRADHQIKLRGFRIELGEIETALAAHPWVREAATIVREDRAGDPRLVGYVVPDAVAIGDRTHELLPQLREWLDTRLPAYMVPSAIVPLDALPLTTNGKLDRRALAAAEHAPLEQRAAYVAPRSAEEEILCEIWSDLLGVSRPGVHDNFFELGGHSLTATQLVSRIREALRVDPPVRAIFDHPTIAGLAAVLDRGADNAELVKPPIIPVPREARTPLSYAQHRLWVLDQMGAGVAYNISWTFMLEGTLDVDVLQRSVNAIVQRHEALRTRFPVDDGEPCQEILPELEIALEVVDLGARSRDERAAELANRCAEFGARTFDLVEGPLLRAAVFDLGDDRHVVAISIHHIVFDAWSIGVLNRELAAHYRAFLAGETPQVPSLAVQYADFAHWQRAWLSGDMYETHLAYWREKLAGVPVLELSTDRLRPALQTYDGAVEYFNVPASLSRDLKTLGRRHGATLTMTLMTAFKALLHRYTGQDDIVIGAPIANRNYGEIEDLIGFFVNSLAMRTDLSGDPSFTELLRRVKDVALEAYEHQDFPFDRLVDELQPERDPSRNPIFQVMLSVQNVPPGELSLPDVTLGGVAPNSTATRFDIEFHLSESDAGVGGALCYNTALFDAETIRGMVRHLHRILASVAADPELPLSALPLFAPEEHDRIVHAWNETTSDYPRDATVPELFAEQAARAPEDTAVWYDDETLTYGELHRRSNRVAHLLREQGVGPNVMVGICADRGVEMVVGILGILKAGGAYVPLATDYPTQRLGFMLEDTSAPVLLVEPHLRDVLPAFDGRVIDLDGTEIATRPDTDVPGIGTSSDVAYVMYTSGSTGEPKGIRIPHRAIARLVLNTDYVDLHADDRIGQAANVSFDAATFEIWGALLNGAQLVGVSKEDALSPTAFRAAIRERGITTLFVTTALFNQLSLEAPDIFAPLRYLLFGGEAVDPGRVRAVLETGRPEHLLHVYGPTENTTFSTWHEVRAVAPDAATVPIGRPIANTTAYVLDAGLRPVAVGVPGELYLGGDGLALDYLDREALTRERFVAHPFVKDSGARLYRTGDVVRYRHDGAIEFVGRIDHQVKLRGFRIELGEIESVLDQHPQIDHSVALVRAERSGNRRLVAYMVPRNGASLETPEVQAFLKERLPAYMVPSALVELASLPLTPNGKLDRSALPDPDPAASAQTYEAPRNRIEQTLAGIWSTVLGVETVGVHDNFFELGGDSILSIQIVARANDAGLRLTPRQLLQRQTVSELAQVAGEGTRVSAEQGPVTGDVPLTPIQRWFFDQDLSDPHHFNQATFFAVRSRTPAAIFRQAFGCIIEHHDALRLRYERRDDGWHQWNAAPDDDVPLNEFDLAGRPEAEQLEVMRVEAERLQRSLTLGEGPLLRAALFDLGGDAGQRLLVAIHHLAVDGVSWRILSEDLQRACASLTAGETVELPAKTTSFRDWARRTQAFAQGGDLDDELDHWLMQPWSEVGSLRPDHQGVGDTGQPVERVTASLTGAETSALLQEVPEAYNTQINDVLLAALATAMAAWTERDAVLIDLEGHGREDLFDDVDISRTVGWFTTMFPVVIDLRGCGASAGGGAGGGGGRPEPGATLKSVKEQLRSIPRRGIGYGLVRYLSADPSLTERFARIPSAQVTFNYLGQLDQMFDGESMLGLANEPTGSQVSSRNRRPHLLDVGASILGGQLRVHLSFGATVFDRVTMDRLAERLMESLRELISHCRSKTDRDYTPSDFPMADLDEEEFSQISDLLKRLDQTD